MIICAIWELFNSSHSQQLEDVRWKSPNQVLTTYNYNRRTLKYRFLFI